MSKYAWIITQDNIDDGDSLNVIGPRNASFDAEFIKNNGDKFRMLDDDGEIYYYGYFYAQPDHDAPDEGFEPLMDFGMPNAGCTEIQYKDKETGEYRTL